MINNLETTAYIIVSWNNKDLLGECIESIYAQKYEGKKRIVLVDNASTDGTVEYIKTVYPEIELIPEHENHGFAKGNNLGVAHVMTDKTVSYVVLLNTDARLQSDWTNTLVSAAQKRPLSATLQSITLDYYDHNIIDSTHIFISRYGQANQGSWRLPISKGHDIAPQKVFGCNAAAMMITRKFIEAQPFRDLLDETMFMYLEDVDLAARATVMGWDNFVIPGTRAFHMGSVSSNKKDPRFSLYMTFRNNTGLLIKNLPTRTLATLLIRMLKADVAAMRHLRRIGRGRAVAAVIKGRLVSLLFIPIFLYKRHKLKPNRKIDEDYLWHLMDKGF